MVSRVMVSRSSLGRLWFGTERTVQEKLDRPFSFVLQKVNYEICC
jgi:hypothetical protein